MAAVISLLVATSWLACWVKVQPGCPRRTAWTATGASGQASPVELSRTKILTSTSPARGGVGEVKIVT